MVSFTITAALQAGLSTLLDYLSAHVLTCLVPAFFIAGAIAALLQKETVLKYFGADAPKWLCYSVAATSGTILAVCSCTILPMFAGIQKRGAGIGPAAAFLFSGPAINLMAIILTARVLGLELGAARALAAVVMAVIIGLIMAAIFQKTDQKCPVSSARPDASDFQMVSDPSQTSRPDYANGIFIALLVAILLSATSGALQLLPKAIIVGLLVLAAAWMMKKYYRPDERDAFLNETWWLAKKIFPLLVVGTFITGIIGYFLPVEWIRSLFGTNSFFSCFVASMIGALLYMPTLLEVPIVGTLFGYSSGITAAGPALSLLLAGPSLSLPSMIVITKVIGLKKGGAYIVLVVLMSTLAGMVYGSIA
ncbi:MAG: putative permease [Methanosaeta sp. PtaU1.Bin112]|nr:MAG: putative permease [Methanosaeta sp. PtaU1.Bin112]